MLDDAFQHRKIRAGFYVLLTSYSKLFTKDWLLPAGNLRESASGAQRANTVIVTKCPSNISDSEKKSIKQQLKLKSYQSLYFSTVDYASPVSEDDDFDFNKPFVLVTGIADSSQLVQYLEEKGKQFTHLNYSDHHNFSEADKKVILQKAVDLGYQILTTEKDFQRLNTNLFKDSCVPFGYLPISVRIIDDSNRFSSEIINFVEGFFAEKTEG